ncbi:MAG: succinylglutamate desuccinylase/aspartoacylase family protein [Cyclobacteriaceae bacterium]
MKEALKTKEFNRKLDQRLIGKIEAGKGPTVIFTAGIHGNEPSGVFALQDVLSEISGSPDIISGNVYALAGNLSALRQGKRYNERDLNRIWTRDRIKRLENSAEPDSVVMDIREQYELHTEIKSIIQGKEGPFFFIDLHTTSSHTIPFLTINDTMINRKFALKFPIPVILGIEEYLNGPLLSYINELGYVACGFEAGQHEEHISYRNQISYIYLVLEACGILADGDEITMHKQAIASQTKGRHDFFEISEYYRIKDGEEFIMKPGFSNFQRIPRNTLLATSNGKELYSEKKGLIFMPLYQKQGEDGYFLIRRVSAFALWLSALLRKIRFDHVLTWLPGVSWLSEEKDRMRVDLRVARFLAQDLFHLLGYRTKQRGKDYLIITNRERASRTDEYRGWL